MREIWDAVQAGDLERAREIDAGLREVYAAMGVTTNPIPVKAALEMTGLIPSGTPATSPRARRRGAASDRDARRSRASASPR